MEFKVIKTIYFSNSENNTGRDEEFEIQQEKTTTQYQKIPKGSEKTYICDGGILTCPNIGKILLNSKYLIKEKNEKNIYTYNEFVFNIRV